jgi:hypothetical protein
MLNENSKFFCIKGMAEEDVHKAIKYNVWCSTKFGNKYLNDNFKKVSQNGGSVFLFFSCQDIMRYLGVARMKSEVQFDKMFPFWTRDNKWGGLFELEWIFIKDLPFKLFKEISIKMNDGVVRPVTFSRDCQEFSSNEGKIMMEIVANFTNSNTILEHFEYYDIRQENYEMMKRSQNFQSVPNVQYLNYYNSTINMKAPQADY